MEMVYLFSLRRLSIALGSFLVTMNGVSRLKPSHILAYHKIFYQES